MIPKGKTGQYLGVGLVNTVLKVFSCIMNDRIVKGIEYHNFVHGFREGRGTSTAMLEVKLLMDHGTFTDNTVYQVLIDLKKAYDSVDRQRVLEIMEKYGVGIWMRWIMENFWTNKRMELHQGRCYGEILTPTQGVTQGDTISPTIFNIVVDAVFKEVSFQVNQK